MNQINTNTNGLEPADSAHAAAVANIMSMAARLQAPVVLGYRLFDRQLDAAEVADIADGGVYHDEWMAAKTKAVLIALPDGTLHRRGIDELSWQQRSR